jgi:hypothetical protein
MRVAARGSAQTFDRPNNAASRMRALDRSAVHAYSVSQMIFGSEDRAKVLEQSPGIAGTLIRRFDNEKPFSFARAAFLAERAATLRHSIEG